MPLIPQTLVPKPHTPIVVGPISHTLQALASKPHIPMVEDPYPLSLKPMTPKPTSSGWGSPHPMPPSPGPIATGAWKWQQPLPSPMAPGSRLHPAPVSRPQTNQRSLGPSPRDYSPAGLAGQGWGWPDPGKPERIYRQSHEKPPPGWPWVLGMGGGHNGDHRRARVPCAPGSSPPPAWFPSLYWFPLLFFFMEIYKIQKKKNKKQRKLPRMSLSA